jgi:hypothetical protein
VPVLHVRAARAYLGHVLRPVRLRDQCDGRHAAQPQHQQCCGEDAPRTARPEVRQRDRGRAIELAQKQGRDQETGDHEEDIDADESPGDARRPQVIGQHEEDRQGSQRLDLGASCVDRRATSPWADARGHRARRDRRTRRRRHATAPHGGQAHVLSGLLDTGCCGASNARTRNAGASSTFVTATSRSARASCDGVGRSPLPCTVCARREFVGDMLPSLRSAPVSRPACDTSPVAAHIGPREAPRNGRYLRCG